MFRDKKRVLITGAGGQLGQEVAKVFSQNPSYQVSPKSHWDLDITKREQVEFVLKKEKPAIIIHCAAWTNVEAAAEDPKEAMRVNGEGTKYICEAAKRIGAKVVYISTNEVFNGKKSSPYIEGDNPNPINSYGQSKLTGEKFCQEVLGNDCTIVRSSWLYGLASKNNFPNKILDKFKEQGFLEVVDDEIGVPTYATDVATIIFELVKKNATGIFHTVSKGHASRYSWAKKILELLDYRNAKIEPIKLKDLKRASTPPTYSVLSTQKIEDLGIKPRYWEESLSDYIKALKRSVVVSKIKPNNI